MSGELLKALIYYVKYVKYVKYVNLRNKNSLEIETLFKNYKNIKINSKLFQTISRWVREHFRYLHPTKFSNH